MNAINQIIKINEIIFQDINDEYANGLYLGVNVIIMKTNGYINGSKLCSASNKLLTDWKRLKNTQEYINYIEEIAYGNSHRPLFITINDENNEIKGTYLNHDLIVDLCSWLSPEFKYKVSKIVNEFAINHLKAKIAIKDAIINMKNENYVPSPANEGKEHILYIKRIWGGSFQVHRIQKERYKTHENIIVSIETPNAINLGVRLRERLHYRGNKITLNNMSEQQLIDIVNEINDEKLL